MHTISQTGCSPDLFQQQCGDRRHSCIHREIRLHGHDFIHQSLNECGRIKDLALKISTAQDRVDINHLKHQIRTANGLMKRIGRHPHGLPRTQDENAVRYADRHASSLINGKLSPIMRMEFVDETSGIDIRKPHNRRRSGRQI